jgi:hemolysin III
MARRELTPGEELANALTHGFGTCLALVGFGSLAVPAVRGGTAIEIFSYTVYGLAAILLYLCSTLYHALTHPRAKQVFAVLDRSMIAVMIAGSYTPFSLLIVRGGWGWFLFITSWVLAAVAVLLTVGAREGYRPLRVAVYAVAGWLLVLCHGPASRAIGPEAMLWLVAGGLAYTVGIAFYAARKVRWSHTIWHVCVIAGSVLQFVALRIALQYRAVAP